MNARNTIPLITDPMGSVWKQPDTSEIEIDDTHALMMPGTLKELAEYNTSQPSGVYPGKMWKRNVNVFMPKTEPHWYLCWFGFSEKGENFCSNNYREIILSD